MNYFRFTVYLAIALTVFGAKAGSYDDYFRAVNVDDARTVSGLLARGFDPNAPDEKGQVGLFLAIRGDSPKVAEVLLHSPDLHIDQANAAGETPLMMAALRGKLDWATRLIDKGAAVDREGWTPLHYAASGAGAGSSTGNEARIITLLLDRGARIDAPSPNHTTPLMMAAHYGTESAAEALIARGADAKLRNDRGLSAADFARSAGRESLARRLDQLAR